MAQHASGTRMRLFSFMLVFCLLALSWTTSFAEAAVKVFQAGQPVIIIKEDLQLGSSSLKGNKLNRGTAAQEVLRFIATQRGVFGLNAVSGESLQLRRAHLDEDGISLRFVQRHSRVHIEGAEVVAILDVQGRLKALNSSLIPTPSFNVNPEISRADALAAAVGKLGYADAELGDGHADGLLIATPANERPILVWQFSLREHADGSNAVQVQVIAQGVRKGEIFRALSLSHDAAGKISIYDSSVTVVIPNPIYKGVKVLEDGRKTILGHALVSKEAWSANESIEKVLGFFRNVFRRDSYDGAGAKIDAVVNVQRFKFADILGQRQNAAWMGPWKMFIFGAGGDELGGFTSALDVVGHEFTHAVISSTSDLAYSGQSGALNEHLADVFGAMTQSHFENYSNPFLIGESVLRGSFRKKAEALRDMLHPEKGLMPQPTKMSEIAPQFGPSCRPSMNNDNCGVHILSGVPNRASALIIQQLGWDVTNRLFYRVMTARLRSSSQFADYRNQMVDECENSMLAHQCQVVTQAFAEVGL